MDEETDINDVIICYPFDIFFSSLKIKHILIFCCRALQDKVDMLEAEKDSHVNKISDLRSLLKKVNQEGEKRVTFIKNKNVSLLVFSSIFRLP